MRSVICVLHEKQPFCVSLITHTHLSYLPESCPPDPQFSCLLHTQLLRRFRSSVTAAHACSSPPCLRFPKSSQKGIRLHSVSLFKYGRMSHSSSGLCAGFRLGFRRRMERLLLTSLQPLTAESFSRNLWRPERPMVSKGFPSSMET